MQHNKNCQNCESGVSEIIGVVLLIALVVTAIAVISLGMFSQPPPQKIPALDAIISTSGNSIQITHNGGDQMQKEDVVILVDGVDKTSSFSKGGDSSWQSLSPGDSLTSNSPNPGTVTILYKGGSANAMLSSAKFSEVGNVTADFRITASSGSGGTISPTGTVPAIYGESYTFTITPNSGYHIVDVLVDGSSVGAVSSYTIGPVMKDYTISATFAITTYTITPSAGAGGAISPNTPQNVIFGGSQGFTITPDLHYHITDVLVDGGSIGANSSYTFTNVAADHTIAASFAIDTYTINATAGANGAIVPSGAVSVNYGASQIFNINPNAGYHIAGVLVDGGSVGTNSSYTFSSVAANHTISATFAINSYTITPTAGSGGAISPSTPQTVTYGGNQAFSITPNAHYHITDVLVDGGSVGTPSNYTFTNVQASHTINASFAIDTYTITATNDTFGSVTPAGVTSVNYGSNQMYTITPTTGYHVTDVLVDSVSQGTISSYTFSNVVANHTISATFAINTYTISPFVYGGNGAISPATNQTVNYGATPAFTFSPATGYHLNTVTVDGSPVTPVGNSYTFPAVTANHTIVGTFAINTYTITAVNDTFGAVTPAGVTTVNYGATPTYTITPNTGYHILDVTVNGTSVGAVTSYQFPSVTTDKTISATFAINTYTITAVNDTFGAVTPAGVTTVNYGATPTYTITPNTGYHVLDVTVNGTSVGAVTSYQFPAVTTNNIISATFAINTYTITATNDTLGSVTPAGITTVNYGGSQAYTIAAITGYHIANVFIDSVSNGTISSYTFTNVQTNHTISATFEINTYTIAVSSGANGAIIPNGSVIVNYNASQIFNINPNTGYRVADVLVDDVSNGTISSYTFSNVKDNHTISATFAIRTFNITTSSGANGAIIPNGTISVNYGASQEFTFVPDRKNHTQTMVVDGVITTYPPKIDSPYTFSNVQDNHTISVTFASNARQQIYFETFDGSSGTWPYTGIYAWTRAGTNVVTSNTVNLYNGTYSIRIRNKNWMSKTISTVGYDDIIAEYKWGAAGVSGTEYTRSLYYTNSSYTTNVLAARQGTLSPITTVTSSILPAYTNDNPLFGLRFQIYGSANTDYLYIDDVKVTGIPYYI